ncbi:hypothetical protein [Ferruginivarius sediminum]|uniref:hypothetical protein n=1 Tax=Ferruginivarius sediminum TaxID=2661937 RepID=UPI0011C05325|nr:hypothetical protein [Ferruginivarius sediminum]
MTPLPSDDGPEFYVVSGGQSETKGLRYQAEAKASGGGGGGMSVDMRDYVDAKTDSVRSELEADVTRLESKIDNLPSKTLWMIAGGVVATVTLVVAVFAYGGDRFEGGFESGSTFATQVEQNRSALENMRENISGLRGDVKKVLQAIERQGDSGTTVPQSSETQ